MNLIKNVREGVLNLKKIRIPILLSDEDEEILTAVATLLGEHHLEDITLEIFQLRGDYLKQLENSKKYCQISGDDRQEALKRARLYASVIRCKICEGMLALSSEGCRDVYFDSHKNEYVVLL